MMRIVLAAALLWLWTGRAEPASISRAGTMHEQRAGHTATLLRDGRVLVAGGFKKGPDGYTQIYFRSAELYDPATKRFTPTGEMHDARAGHIAVLLRDGTVLVAGGFGGNGMLSGAEIYNPSSGTFTSAGRMMTPRGDFTATLLNNGKVLVAGGGDLDATSSAELYDPLARTFSPGPSMITARKAQTATLMADGRVLIAGGSPREHLVLSTAEIYDPAEGTFTSAGSMGAARYKHAAIALKDGRILIAGGSDGRDWKGKLSSCEIYNPGRRSFTPAGRMGDQRFKFPSAIVMLKNGTVLLCGGAPRIESFDGGTEEFRPGVKLDAAFYYATATMLRNGSVLILGGYDDHQRSTNKAWIYKG